MTQPNPYLSDTKKKANGFGLVPLHLFLPLMLELFLPDLESAFCSLMTLL